MAPGAIEDFDLVRFQGPTVPQEFPRTIDNVIPTRIVTNDPDRLELYLTNNSTNVLRWSINSNLSATNSQQLGSGQTLLIQVQNDGGLTGVELWGLMDTAPGNVQVLLVRRQQRGAR